MKVNKISVIFVITTLVITSLGVVINNDDVLATPDPENITFDYQLIYDVTQNLSWRINQSYDIENGELAKGRYFGSKGEHDAAEYIALQMGYFGLFDLNYSALSYRQQIENSETLQIRYKKLSVYNHSSHQSKSIDECYIGTEWKLLKELRDFNHTWQNVEIEYLGPLFSIFNPYYNNFCNHTFNFSFFNDLIDNESRQEEGNFSDYLVGLFENYYNFTFNDIFEHPENATLLPWYNQTEYYYGKNNYALISENPKFHPNMSVFPRIDTIEENINNILQNLGYEGHYEVNEMQILWQLAKQVWQRLILLWCQMHRCEAVILYDLDPVCFDTLSEKNKFPIPVININGTLGEEINNSREDFTINFTIDQYWDDTVESYNVVGQINGTNSNRNIIIDCLYDSVWCQGTSDSAIGCGMVLSLAEKMKDLEGLAIHPKYNVRFILFGGEETGALGAKYYAHNEDHDIDSVIDLNQLGFDQRDPEVPLIMNVASNKFFMTPILQHITDITQYEERTNDNTQVRVSWTPFGSVSDENPFGRLGSTRPFCKTIMFLKDMNWTRHHRDGAKHTDGDSMDYYDEDEVRLTMEMIWNVTRFLAYNPDTWFVKDSVEYSFTDDENDENSDPDTVTVSFDIDTSFPEDKATVKVILVPRYISNLLHPAYPVLYRYRAEKDFIVTPDGVSGEITLQLPKGAPAADYRVNVVLLDSRGEVFSSFLGEDGILTQTVDNIQDFSELLENFFDDDCEEQLLQYSDEIYEDYHINIAEFLDKYPHLQDVQNLIQDLFSIYCFSDDREHACAQLSPPNDPPAQPDKPTGPKIVAPHETASYRTTTTDPNGDSVQYKWRFQFGDLFQFNRWSNIFSSGVEHTQSHTWGDLCVPHWVTVKARDCQEDEWTSTNVQSGYSDILWVFVNPGGWFNAPQEILVGETMEYQAQVEGIQPEQYLWNFGESENWEQTRETTIEKTYEENGTYLVQLKIIDDEQHEYLYSKNIDVQYLISQFNSSSGKIDQPLWFNDSSRKCNGINITNRTWDFDDGTIVYDTQSVSHIFQSPGIYNVTLTVVDEDNDCIDSSSTIIYIESHPPVVQSISCDPFIIAPNHEVTFSADITDGTSGIHTATLNISRPDGTWNVLPMLPIEEGPYDFDSNYTALYTDTEHIGEYYYSIFVEDNAGNNVSHGGFSFTVSTLAFLPITPYYGTVPYDDIPVDLFSSIDASQHYAFTSIAGDVVLWMPMDETTTEYNPMDVSGYENDGVCRGGANQTGNGSFGKGFLFDGMDDYLEIEPNASIMFNASQPMTWSFWICPEYSAVNTTMGVLSKASSASNGSGFTFCLNTTTNDVSFIICAPDAGVLRYSDSVDLNIGNSSWAQLTVVYNGSFGWDVYVNGSKKDTLFFSLSSNVNASYLLGAGRNATGDAADLFFQGMLDDFVMFKRGVDADEIPSLFNASEYPYSHNFTDLTDGTYNFTGCAGYPRGFANTTETRSILIDTLAPIISNVTDAPDTVGFGGNVQINATVAENGSGLLLVAVNISYPNATSWNYSMTCVGEDAYQLNFSDTWFVGQYNYSVWAMDNVGNTLCDSGHSFNVTANATISIATLKNSYSGTQYINITDPPNPTENLTLVGRGLSWNTYYSASSGQNILEAYQGPVNYQEENGTWTPINNTLTQLTSDHPAYVYGYRNGNDQGLYGVYFKSNAQLDWPVAFTYNRSDDPTVHVVRSKLVGVGYVDPQSNWAYQYLQNTQSSQGQTSDYSITYPGVFTGTDVTWSYGNTGLKEEITLSNTTKTVLQNHPPSQYGLNDASSYLVFITKLDYQNLNLYNNSGLLEGNVTISDTGVDFRDVLGQFKCALPLGEAYELNNETARQKLTYRIIYLNGDAYLLSGLKVSDLNAMTFPVVVDPTLTVYSVSNDGYIYNSGFVYSTVQSASSGTVDSSSIYVTIGQKRGVGPTYDVYRGFVLFNTSALPSNAYLDDATLSLYKKDDYSSMDFDITIQNGQPTYPHNPMQNGDYYRGYYSGNGGSLNTSRFTSGYNAIPLNNLSWINSTGVTKLCLRSSRDINGNSPTGNEYINVYSGNAFEPGGGITYKPKLVITYRNQSKIKDTGSTDIKGYLLIQIHFYETGKGVAPRWVVDNDTINETTPRIITSESQLALDTIFNGLVRASDLTYGTGSYRVYAAFRDPEGNILRTNDGTELKTWWQFNKT